MLTKITAAQIVDRRDKRGIALHMARRELQIIQLDEAITALPDGPVKDILGEIRLIVLPYPED